MVTMVAAFIATFFFNINVIYILLAAVCVGIALAIYDRKKKEEKA